MSVRSIISGFVLALATVTASAIEAVAECVRAIGAIPSLQGEAQVQAATAGVWRPAALNEQLCPGDVIHVGERSRAQVTIVNQPNVRLDQNTALHLPSDDDPLIVRLLYGAAYFFSRHPRKLTVDTPFIDAAVEGTEFLVRVEAERTLIIVFAGRIRASNAHGELAIADGEAATAQAGQPPAPYLIVRPRDAVQWTLFYPAILPALADPSGAAAQGLPEPLRDAVSLAAAGQLPAAFARFEAIPEAERDSDYYLYRAAALLSVGRVEEARADIGQALLRDPTDGRADALSAVIAVAQNDRDRALAEAQRAVELSPRSAAAKIALSYAEQARFQIEAARQALEQAVKDEPENALAWARLSELWLMQGRRDRARRAAKRARELAPELARVQTVLGFAELAEINTGRAKKAFRRAIAIDSANPLPRFGLGLATIRAGDLEQGRKEIEIAVALDPENALLRSYLGKAYFDERTTNPLTYFQELVTNFPNQENTLAAEQFAISKELDPNDPTPWLYNAIRLQSENRPVEALRDLEKSIELNDNRAVYRSRELLDQDRAARGASLARIYNDLGFEQLGINEATKSLSLDPSNAAAHRFLSDVYATQPRSEIARVSELLQAQLLQDININPVQPSLSETNLGIITSGGPARPGFNEFTPLFERNQAQLNLSGVVGSDWTRGEEAIVSGIYDNFSISAGQFHYQSDGFRDNFHIQHDIYDFYAQAAITPELNAQAELRSRRTEEGDLRLNFDPDNFSNNRHRDLDQDTGRLGLRYSPSPSSDILTFAYLH
jgi:tetratricopeptide (TPR) repeat protein